MRDDVTDYRCSANENCPEQGERSDGSIPLEQHDRYGIYAGRWHEDCWDRWGYGDFVFDAGAAGESLEEVE